MWPLVSSVVTGHWSVTSTVQLMLSPTRPTRWWIDPNDHWSLAGHSVAWPVAWPHWDRPSPTGHRARWEGIPVWLADAAAGASSPWKPSTNWGTVTYCSFTCLFVLVVRPHRHTFWTSGGWMPPACPYIILVHTYKECVSRLRWNVCRFPVWSMSNHSPQSHNLWLLLYLRYISSFDSLPTFTLHTSQVWLCLPTFTHFLILTYKSLHTSQVSLS